MKLSFVRFALAILLLQSPLAQASDDLTSWRGRPLVFAIPDETYLPFHSWEANGEPKGFDVDLANAICTRLQATCSTQRVSFDQILQGLMKRKKYDAAIGALDITPGRLKVADFSQPYIQMPGAFAVRKAEPVTPTAEGLKGKRVGVGRPCPKWPSSGADFIRKSFGPDVEVVYFDAAAACPKRGYFVAGEMKDTFPPRLDALAAGKLDAVFDDKLSLYYVIGRNYGGTLALAPADFFDYRSGQGIAVRKHRDDLKAALDAAISSLVADGTYQSIAGRYFPFPMLPQ